jgi:RNA polymerase sigma-70 factor (ECF subfamily)
VKGVRGDDDFDAFFRADFPRLVAFLCKAGFEVETARDVATEAMLHAYEAWPILEDPRAWVRRTAGRLVDAPDQVRDEWAPLGGDERLAALVEQHSQIIRLLADLPEQQRMVLTWSLDGFTPAQIAKALKLSPATVRSNLRHVRMRLRRHYGAPPHGTARDEER